MVNNLLFKYVILIKVEIIKERNKKKKLKTFKGLYPNYQYHLRKAKFYLFIYFK